MGIERSCFYLPMGKGESTRETVLREALAQSSRVGLRGITIGGLADSLEMSKSGLFAHFRSKEGLQAAVLDYATDAFVRLVIHPALTSPRGEPRLRTLFERWLGGTATATSPCPAAASSLRSPRSSTTNLTARSATRSSAASATSSTPSRPSSAPA